jgi:hypothetical protein
MRLEASVPDNRGNAVVELAKELGMSRSQVIDEAIALFLKAVMEVRRGRRLVTVDPNSAAPVCEIATPTLAALEWAMRPATVELPGPAFAKLHTIADAPSPPGPRLRAATGRHAR